MSAQRWLQSRLKHSTLCHLWRPEYPQQHPAMTTRQTRQNPERQPRREDGREEQKLPRRGRGRGGERRKRMEGDGESKTPACFLVKTSRPSGYSRSFLIKEALTAMKQRSFPLFPAPCGGAAPYVAPFPPATQRPQPLPAPASTARLHLSCTRNSDVQVAEAALEESWLAGLVPAFPPTFSDL